MPTLADVYLARARSESDQELRRAAIEAQRSTAKSAIWGNAISNIGQTVAQGLASYGEQKQRQPLVDLQVKEGQQRVEANDAAIAGAKSAAERKAATDKMMGEWLKAGDDGLPEYDIPGMTQAFNDAGMTDDLDARVKSASAINTAIKAAKQSNINALATLAADVENNGNDPDRFINQLKFAAVHSLVPKDMAMKLIEQVQQDPSAVGQITGALIARSPEAQKLLKTPKFSSVGPDGGVLNEQTGEVRPTGIVKPPTPAALQSKEVMIDGKPALTSFNPQTGQYSIAGQDVTAKVTPVLPREPQGPTAPVAVIGSDGKPVFVKPTDAYGRTPASTREQGRPVPAGKATEIADLNTSLNDLATLTDTVKGINATGTMAEIGAMLPNAITNATGIGVEPKQKQAVIDRVKQVIGKALEGGVLRKEDEYKYTKILPTIGDHPDVVATKLEGLQRAIEQRRQTMLEALEDGGFDISRFVTRGPSGTSTATNASPAPSSLVTSPPPDQSGNWRWDGSKWVKK